MARAPSKRLVMNRAALDAFQLGMADALAQAGQDILAAAAPNVPPEVAKTGGVYVSYQGRKVAGTGNKPRRFQVRAGTVAMVVGYGSPLAHLWEFGTSAHEITLNTKSGKRVLSAGPEGPTFGTRVPRHPGTRPRPALLPAFNSRIGGADRYLLPAVARRLRAVR